MAQKRVLAIHDISCVGRCSLTVALPIISAAGIECSVIPTAVLSTHTGGFTGFTYRDLTADIKPIVKHWKTLGLHFDAIYTGFLGSFEQVDIVCDIIDELRDEKTLVVVDPCMADNGQLYKVFPPKYPDAMKKLCRKADILLPNITEACLLAGQVYKDGPYTRGWTESLLNSLGEICKKVILTGVHFSSNDLGAAAYDADTGKVDYSFRKLVPGYYHGTGDVFGSVAVASLVRGCSLAESNWTAVDFTVGSINRTREAGTDVKYGVNFEEGLPKLAKDLGL